MFSPIHSVNLRAKLNQGAAIKCSQDGLISVLCQDGVYILKLGSCADNVSPTLTVSRYFIPNPKEPLRCDIGVSKEELLSGMTHSRLTELLMDPALNPNMVSSFSFTGVRRLSWSPTRVDPLQRCVLASLSEDHRLCVHSLKSNPSSWSQICDLSEPWQEYAKQKNFILDEGKSFSTLLDRIVYQRYILAPQEMAWYPEVLSSQRALLCTALKSGHIVMWSFTLPLTSSPCMSASDRSATDLAGVYHVCNSIPTSLQWIPIGQDNSALCTIAFDNGVIEGIHVTFNDLETGHVTFGEKVTLWAEADYISAYCMEWCDTTRVLAAGKGCHLVKFKFVDREVEEGCIKSFYTEHETVQARLPIISEVALFVCNKPGICLKEGVGFVSTGDNMVHHVKISGQPIIGAAFNSPDPIISKLHTLPITKWLNHGCMITPSASFFITVQSPGVPFDHLKEREPVRVQVFQLFDASEALDRALLLAGDSSEGGIIPTDLLSNIRLGVWNKVIKWSDERITALLASKQQITLPSLQLARFLLGIKLTIKSLKIKETTEVGDISNEIASTEELILCKHAMNVLHSLSESPSLSARDETVASLLCYCLQKYNQPTSSDFLTKCLHKVGLSKLSQVKETCQVCDSSIQFGSIRRDACENGHQFERCCQTLTLCQAMSYRKCAGCGVYALPVSDTEEWIRSIQSPRCVLCGDYLTDP